jgi:hypothetical protein
MTYERKTRGPRAGNKGKTPIHISVSVEPINPCATNTPERTPPFRQPNFSGRNAAGSTSTQGATTGGAILGSISQGYTPRRGSSSSFRMAGHDPTIRLPEFKGEASRTLRRTCSSMKRYGKKRRSHMRIQKLCR